MYLSRLENVLVYSPRVEIVHIYSLRLENCPYVLTKGKQLSLCTHQGQTIVLMYSPRVDDCPCTHQG